MEPPSPTAAEIAPLPRAFYDRDPAQVARELVGALLLRQWQGELLGGRIVETEAYLSRRDRACHAHRGPNRKNRAMFGPPGCVYVYPIHARWCFNAVTEPAGQGSAVLIRALEPLWGLAKMRELRGGAGDRDLCRGPARLCQALAITRQEDGAELTVAHGLWIATADAWRKDTLPALRVVRSPRIGIREAAHRLLRFFAQGSPFVSGPPTLNRAGRR